jgi:hypothetical protein
MTRFSCGVMAVVLGIFATGCQGGGPTTPTGMHPPSNGEAFEVTGIVTDDQGVPVAGAVVTMRYWLGGFIGAPSMRTDASGGYTIGFTANPWMIGTTGSRAAARAEVVADGYDWYLRNVLATNPRVENFRLLRSIKPMTAGDSIVVSVTPDSGDCPGWLLGPCARLRVEAPANGNLTVEAVPTQEGAGAPQIQVCCVSGNERYGNPITLPVTAGSEVQVDVGQTPGFTTSESVIVKTSLE